LADPDGELWNGSFYDLTISQLDWILGKNPFAVCMMYGHGVTNFPHYPGLPGYAFNNIKGGICNGITAMRADQNDLEWAPYHQRNITDSLWADWRWIEQWLPHNAWYLTALSSLAYRIENPIIPEVSVQVPAVGRHTPGYRIRMERGRSLRLEIDRALENKELSVYTLQGQKVYASALKSGQRSIRIKLPQRIGCGTYVLSIKSMSSGEEYRSRITLR